MILNENFAIGGKSSLPLVDLGCYSLRDPEDISTILVVDDFDIARRALVAMLRSDTAEILEASSGAEALAILSHREIDLIVLDKTMPGMDGLECCRRIKTNRKTELIPVLMLTGANTVEDEIAGIRAGADQFLGKPIHPEVLRTRAASLIRHKTAISRLEETETALFALAQAVEQRDHCTGGHCERLATLSVAFGVRLGLPRRDLLALHRGGYLHDIGKIGIADSILFKTGDLDWAERKAMQTHTIRGEEICRPLRSLERVLPIIRNHHEHWDATGYPDNLEREKIPLLARVMQLADVYDALTTERPYKSALGPAEATAVILDESDRGWYDPDLTRCFIDLTVENGFRDSLWNIQRQFSASGASQLTRSSSA